MGSPLPRVRRFDHRAWQSSVALGRRGARAWRADDRRCARKAHATTEERPTRPHGRWQRRDSNPVTLVVETLAGMEPTRRDAWLAEFAAAASDLRAGTPELPYAPSREYSSWVVQLSQTRPSDLFVVRDGSRVVGRALAAAAPGSPDAAVVGLFEVTL